MPPKPPRRSIHLLMRPTTAIRVAYRARVLGALNEIPESWVL